ncbi:hypothetical protein OEZ86_004813 [Tetradesmus obliquus]|nr:hypothetical protein OEZ86_004813 [Tetradesmus obliquus]
MQEELAAAATAFASKEESMRKQLDASKQGLQANMLQMETALADLAAVDARRSQLESDKAALEAEKAALLDRCLVAERQLSELRDRQSAQSEQLIALRLQLGQPQAIGGKSRAYVAGEGGLAGSKKGLADLIPDPSPAPAVGMAEVQELQQQLTTADEAQTALTLQLLEKDQEVKLFAQNSGSASSWRLSAESNGGATPPAATAALESALAEARHQLGCWEQDVMALEFVAKHEAFDDICDLDMTYNNSHLETIHRAVMQLRKSLADAASSSTSAAADEAQSRAAAPAAVAVASTSTGSSLPSSPLGRSSAAGPDLATSLLSPSSANASPRTKNALKFAALEAQAGSATSRSLAVGSALDTSLQAMQAAKLSLMSMHDKDVKLELISQSVQEVLAGGKVGESAASSRGGAPSSAGASSAKASSGGVVAEASATSIPESLLAAKTLQEVEAIVARVFSSDGGSSAASGSTYNGSNGGSNIGGNGVSRLSGTGARDSMPGAEDVAAVSHLAAELERYKQQLQELQEAHEVMQAEALLANAKAEEAAALQAANEQLVLQVTVLNQAAEQASSSSQRQQQELQQQLEALKAANADLQAGKQELASSVLDLQAQLEQLQQERERLQQQNARLKWLEEELVDLQLQIADLVQQNKDLAAELAAAKLQQLAKPATHSDASMQSAATSDSAAAVSAVRAATQSLMQLEVGTEQLMLPSTDSNTPTAGKLATRRPGQEWGPGGSDHQQDSVLRPLQEPLLSAMLPDQPMAQMLSSEHNEDMHSRPFSAEMETEYMHYSNTALMAQSLAEGSSRRPALPTTEEDADDVAGQQGSNAADASAPAAGAVAAAGNSSALSTGSSTGTGRRSSQLQSREYVVIVPGAAGDTSSSATPATAGGVIASSATATSSGSRRTPAASQGGLEAQQLAQRVLDRLKKEEQGSTAGRGSWPGGIKDSKKSLMDLRSVAHDVTELATISAELAQQQEAVQQQLAASQQLAEAMRQQAQAHNCSLDEVVGHFFNVYNIACFVASDRESVLDLLIEARSAQQTLSAQLDSRANQIQQLAADRDLALKKLCHSEEKLVALEEAGQITAVPAAAAAAPSDSLIKAVSGKAAAAGLALPSKKLQGGSPRPLQLASPKPSASPRLPAAAAAAAISSPKASAGGAARSAFGRAAAPDSPGPAAAPAGGGPARSAGSGSGGSAGAGGGSGSRGSSGSGGSAAAAAVGRMVRMLSGGGSRPMGGDSSSIMKSKSKDGKEPSRK